MKITNKLVKDIKRMKRRGQREYLKQGYEQKQIYILRQ